MLISAVSSRYFHVDLYLYLDVHGLAANLGTALSKWWYMLAKADNAQQFVHLTFVWVIHRDFASSAVIDAVSQNRKCLR